MCSQILQCGVKDVTSMKSDIQLMQLPQEILKNIFFKCSAKTLGRLSQTCLYFQELISDDSLWCYLCHRDFNLQNPDLGRFQSYSALYKKVLYKYGWMLGTYISSICDGDGLAEIRYNAGTVEGIQWDPIAQENSLAESVIFQIRGDLDPPRILCLPHPTLKSSHDCVLTFNKVRGSVVIQCKDKVGHSEAVTEGRNQGLIGKSYSDLSTLKMRISLLFYCIEMSLLFHPALLPYKNDIPDELRLPDKSVPPQFITPGLFKGFILMPLESDQLICLTYKNEYEIIGKLVSGSTTATTKRNIYLRILLKEAVFPSIEKQKSYDDLKECQREPVPPGHGRVQQFILPEGCRAIGTLPETCMARYKCYVQVLHSPHYSEAHFVIFNNDFLGILSLENPKRFWTYERVHQKFTRNILSNVESAI